MPVVDPESLLIVAGVGGVVGALAALLGGRTPGLLASFFLGALAGVAAALVLRAFGADPILGVGGLSIVYAAAAAFVLTFAIAYSSGRS